MAGALLPADVLDLTPSARLAYAELRAADRALTRHEVADRIGIGGRTAKRALASLRDRDLAIMRSDPADGRRRLYTAAGGVDSR